MNFSVVIPVYKSAQLLTRALSSLNSSLPFEVILVIDDELPFDYESMLESVGILNWNIIRNTKNRGVTSARNIGVRASVGDYVIFLDSDDELVVSLDRIHKCIGDSTDDLLMFLCRDEHDLVVNRSVDRDKSFKGCLGVLNTYGLGEMLLVIKRPTGRVFFSATRGHELLGLYHYARNREGFETRIVNLIARKYHSDNQLSLSRSLSTNSGGRNKFVGIGHVKLSKYLFNDGNFVSALKWFFKGLARRLL